MLIELDENVSMALVGDSKVRVRRPVGS